MSYGLQLCSFNHADDHYFQFIGANEYEVIGHFIKTVVSQTEKLDEKIKKTNIPFDDTPEVQ